MKKKVAMFFAEIKDSTKRKKTTHYLIFQG